jgi:catechol 2,3-dioxygenase-like lactoylglutathione lyase family enzyme
MAKGLGNKPVVQVGIIVRDIERMIDRYCAVFQLPTRPTVNLTAPVEEAHTVYRGQPSTARAKLAFFPMGQVTIELIEPVGSPSTWQEFLDEHGEGVHHIAFIIDGTPEVVQYLGGHGIPLVQQGDYTGGMYSYLDSAPQLGVVLELLENFR